MRLFGLIGFPLTHSFSKKYFTEKFDKAGLTECRYELFPLTAIGQLPELLAAHPQLEGLNVTIPYKKQVVTFLQALAIPEGLDACNCITIRNGLATGYNTDVTGFENSLVPLLQPHHTKALVLGTGGAAEAVIFVLKKLGIDFKMVSRTANKVTSLAYQEIGEATIRERALIINTTPLGMYPSTDECPDIPYQYLSDKHLLYDLVYNPAKTLFLQKGEERGAAIKNGEEMLVLQAEESWNIWNQQ